MAVIVGGGLVCRVFNNHKVYFTEAKDLYGIIQASVDRKLMPFFDVTEGTTQKDHPLKELFYLRAGASEKKERTISTSRERGV